jgi:hypothetical protein
MNILQRLRRRKPLPVRVAGGMARRVGRVAKGVGRVATSPFRR